MKSTAVYVKLATHTYTAILRTLFLHCYYGSLLVHTPTVKNGNFAGKTVFKDNFAQEEMILGKISTVSDVA